MVKGGVLKDVAVLVDGRTGAAVVEFMNLTNYTFAGAFYVESFNSITSVVRLPSSLGQHFGR